MYIVLSNGRAANDKANLPLEQRLVHLHPQVGAIIPFRRSEDDDFVVCDIKRLEKLFGIVIGRSA